MRILLRSAALTSLLVCAAATTANAGTFLQEGTPQPAAAVETYGMHASIPIALHTVVPKGWTVIIGANLALPGTVSWAPTDTWVEVISRMAKNADAGFIIDWNDQKLLVRSVPGAMKFVSKLAAIDAQATAALPAYSVSSSPARPQAIAPLKPSVAVAPSPAKAPTQPPHAPAVVATAAAPVSKASRSFALIPAGPISPAKSFSDVSARTALEALAGHYHLRLEWHGPDFPLPGPVTFMFNGLRTDVRLLDRSLGPAAPLAIVYYQRSHELSVRHAFLSSYTVRASRPIPVVHESLWAHVGGMFHREPASAARSRLPEKPARTGSTHLRAPAPTVAAVPCTPCDIVPSHHTPSQLTPPAPRQKPPINTTAASAAPAPLFALDIAVGDRLSSDLDGFLRANGWHLSWQVPDDLKADDAGHIAGPSVQAVLAQLLPALGLVADFSPETHVITVRTMTSTSSAGAP